VKKPLGEWRYHQPAYARRAGGFAEDSDGLGIASEHGDVALDPLKRRDLVEHAVVAGDIAPGFLREQRMREESQRAEAVVDGDQHDAPAGKLFAVAVRHRTGAGGAAAAVDPDHDGESVIRACGRGPDVEVKAVLVHLPDGGIEDLLLWLGARGAELGALSNALPMIDRLGRFPSQVPDGRRGERDALVDADLAVGTGFTSADKPRVRLQGVGKLLRRRRSECKAHNERHEANHRDPWRRSSPQA
jgi:hypothetical protein